MGLYTGALQVWDFTVRAAKPLSSREIDYKYEYKRQGNVDGMDPYRVLSGVFWVVCVSIYIYMYTDIYINIYIYIDMHISM